MKIAIMGFGTVGSGAYDVAMAAGGIEVVKILDLVVRKGYEDIADRFTQDLTEITGDPEIELVVEAMGGVDTPRKFVLECLKAGKSVVTPNKNLISACYGELMKTAKENGAELRFTPAAGGGIPWLYSLLRTRRTDNIQEVRGIVNGTCNFILDAMYDSGADFDEMLQTAKELGYAEANPAADIEGTDTLRKTVITHSRNDLQTNNNLITLVGDKVGTLSFYGQGAGKMPTGESVIQDVLDIRDGRVLPIPPADAECRVDNDAAVHRYYIRHDNMCEHIEPLIESYEEKDGIFYCISKPISVVEMHKMGNHRKEKGRDMFFAALDE